jgi:competence protein ComEC
MLFIKRIPFAGIFFSYALGILIYDQMSKQSSLSLAVAASVMLCVFVLGTSVLSFYSRISVWLAVLVFAGLMHAALQDISVDIKSVHVGKWDEGSLIRADILTADTSSRYWKTTARVMGEDMEVKALCYFEKHPGRTIEPGMQLRFSAGPRPISGPMNPDEFDYRNYLEKQGIRLRYYVKAENWEIMQKGRAGQWNRHTGSRIRRDLEEVLESVINDPESLALIEAITLGQRRGLSDETLTAFSNTGARHILTVSGMHVGIVMLIIRFILDSLPVRFRFFQAVKLMLTLAFLWFYAWITGLGPPVLRASFMLSMVLISTGIRRENNTFNALFLSAFILVGFDPDNLFRLGFQFSYLALLSILMFYRPISRLWLPRNRILKYVWQLAAVSLAAQPLILPVSIYYFHTLPLLFILSSTLATPVAFLLLFLCLLLFADWYTLHILYQPLAWITGKLGRFFLDVIEWLDQLSFGTINEIVLNGWEVFFFLSLGMAIYYFLQQKTKIRLALILVLAFLLVHFGIFLQRNENVAELCVYSDNRVCRIDLFTRDRVCHSWNDLDPQDTGPAWVNENHRIARRTRRVEALVPFQHDSISPSGLMLFGYSGFTIAVLNQAHPGIFNCREIDVLLINSNDRQAIAEVLGAMDFSLVIASNQVRNDVIEWIEIHALSPVWDMNRQGAFVKRLNASSL